MPRDAEPVFLVNPYTEPVILRINGRATYLNSSPVSDFFQRLVKAGKRKFIVDFLNCSGMDSTFMGILAGVGLDLQACEPPGTMVLCRLGTRNLELVRNLGLHKIVSVDAGKTSLAFDDSSQKFAALEQGEIENARTILNAHENLVEIDEANRPKFQDVISFLRNQVGPET